jgi:FtsZ-binding cell division protein ZapB
MVLALCAGFVSALAGSGDENETDWETMEFDPGVAEARAAELGAGASDPVKDAEDTVAYFTGSVAELEEERSRLEAEIDEIAVFIELLEAENSSLADTYKRLAEKDEKELDALRIKLESARELLDAAKARLAEAAGEQTVSSEGSAPSEPTPEAVPEDTTPPPETETVLGDGENDPQAAIDTDSAEPGAGDADISDPGADEAYYETPPDGGEWMTDAPQPVIG